MSSTGELLVFFGEDVASKYSGFSNLDLADTVTLESSQLNKLALRTSNPIRFLTLCKEKQSLSNPNLRGFLAALYADLIGEPVANGKSEKLVDANRHQRPFKIGGRCMLRDLDKQTGTLAIYQDLLGFVMGSMSGTILNIESEFEKYTLIVPEEYGAFPRLEDWASVLHFLWSLQSQIDNDYGNWAIKSQNIISRMSELLCRLKVDAFHLYQELNACRAIRSDCWEFLDNCLKECVTFKQTDSSVLPRDLKMIVASSEESSWNKADILSHSIAGGKDFRTVLEASKDYQKIRNLASICGLSFPKYQVFRPLENIYEQPNYSLKSSISRLSEQTSYVKTRLVETRKDIVGKLKSVFKLFLLQDTTFLDDVFRNGGSFMSKECTDSLFSRFLSHVRHLDPDLSHISFVMDDYTTEERLRAINTGIFPSERKQFILLEKLSLYIDDPLVEILLSSENVFKLQILFRFYMNLYYILGCFESHMIDPKSPDGIRVGIFEIVSFIRQFLISIKPFSSPLSDKTDESSLIADIANASDELHQSFKRALLSNSKTCEFFSQIISLSIRFLFESPSESSLVSLKETIGNLLSHWKTLSSRGDMNADFLLQNLDQKHFDSIKSSGHYKY